MKKICATTCAFTLAAGTTFSGVPRKPLSPGRFADGFMRRFGSKANMARPNHFFDSRPGQAATMAFFKETLEAFRARCPYDSDYPNPDKFLPFLLLSILRSDQHLLLYGKAAVSHKNREGMDLIKVNANSRISLLTLLFRLLAGILEIDCAEIASGKGGKDCPALGRQSWPTQRLIADPSDGGVGSICYGSLRELLSVAERTKAIALLDGIVASPDIPNGITGKNPVLLDTKDQKEQEVGEKRPIEVTGFSPRASVSSHVKRHKPNEVMRAQSVAAAAPIDDAESPPLPVPLSPPPPHPVPLSPSPLGDRALQPPHYNRPSGYYFHPVFRCFVWFSNTDFLPPVTTAQTSTSRSQG